MSQIHFIGGEKGGVGKSFVSRLLMQYCIDNAINCIGFELDQSHSSFGRFYGEYIIKNNITINDYESLDNIIAIAEQQPDYNIIIDLPAQSSKGLQTWVEEGETLKIFEELNYKVFLWHVMDDGIDSLYLLETLLEHYAKENVQFVIVENKGRGDDFEYFEKSEIYQKALQSNSQFITLDKLPAKLTQKIDINDCSFWAAANNKEIMNLTERKRVKTWLQKQYQQLNFIE